MKRIVIFTFILLIVFSLCSCSSNAPEEDSLDIESIKEQAIQFAIAKGEEHYREQAQYGDLLYYNHQTPEVQSVEILENKYFDIKCLVPCIYGPEERDDYLSYSLRLRYNETNQTFSIVEQDWSRT